MAQERVSRWSPRTADAVLVGAVVTVSVLNSWIKGTNGLLGNAPVPVIAAVSGMVGVLLWWRRRYPGPVAVAIMVGFVVAFTPTSLAVAMYTVGAAYRRTRTLILQALAACATLFLSLLTSRPTGNLRETLYILALVLGMLVVGQTVAIRRALAAEARAKAEGLEREQHLLVERAQVDERARIAREMHDIVAHRISNIVLTAGALKVSPPARSAPDVARAAEEIHDEGHQALEELRDTLGILTPGRNRRRAPRVPQPDASQLHRLVERATSRGQDARFEVNGHPETLPPPVQRAIYRIAQESLTNVAKHAPGATVTLTVDCRLDGVHISVTNGPPTRPEADDELPSGGNGLIGLEERAALLGGTLTAGPHDNGFKVEAHIPTHPGAPHAGERRAAP
ncbi:sensor histidine kinase [Streptomyces rectiverticillatus]|uniref:sensor histidine kinase n=1 Tax=Streptomyces rectiverticillatus TaxID=173860 RepID=UPI0015C38BAB|nr:histidine kinase [Streptomyces rectiverticillatus]QLE70458.1 sensor histidine kinase [Streptomyces rectiverticillatus]